MNEQTKSFIEELKGREGVLGIVLFGSWARGNNRPDSDVDLLVLHSTDTKRDIEYREGQAFEIVYSTEESVIAYYNSNKDNCVRFWNIAQVIFDKEGGVARLREAAQKIKQEGKKPIVGSQLKQAEFDARDQMKAVESLILSNPETANMLLCEKISNLAGKYFDIKQLWAPAPKQMLAEMKGINPELYGELMGFYKDGALLNEKLIIAKRIVDIVFS